MKANKSEHVIKEIFLLGLKHSLKKTQKIYLITENNNIVGMYTIEEYLAITNLSDELKLELMKRNYNDMNKLELEINDTYVTINLITEKFIKEVEENNYEINHL